MILLTGQDGADAASAAIEAGAFEYLCKLDCTAEELALAVRHAAHATQLRREIAQLSSLQAQAASALLEAQLSLSAS